LIALKREVVEFSGAVILTPTLRASSFCFRVSSSRWESFTFALISTGDLVQILASVWTRVLAVQTRADDSVVATVALGWGRDG
jgi:uncharacterized integral membrane protein